MGLTISSFLSLKFRKFVKLWSATDLGFEVIPTSRVSQYIFGYFQTYKFASDLQVKNKLKKLSVSSIAVEHYRVLAFSEKPLIIHVRLSDYLIESQFGVLSSDYYKNAISVMTEKFGFKNFWVYIEIRIDQASIRTSFPDIFISISIFQGDQFFDIKNQLFRAEWDNYGNIDEKHPPPVEGLGEIAAEHRCEDRPGHNSGAPDR